MKRKSATILPLASALGALAGSGMVADQAKSMPTTDQTVNQQSAASQTGAIANTLVSTGEALLGFVTTEQADGTVLAQHSSHASHASHASHTSGT
jgi:hypothetical protein